MMLIVGTMIGKQLEVTNYGYFNWYHSPILQNLIKSRAKLTIILTTCNKIDNLIMIRS